MNNYTENTLEKDRILLDKIINIFEKLILLENIDNLTNTILHIDIKQFFFKIAQAFYDNDRMELFSIMIDELTTDEKLYFLEKSIVDDNNGYFGILINYINKIDFVRILYELYEKNDNVLFSMMIFSADEKIKSDFRLKINNDKKELFSKLSF